MITKQIGKSCSLKYLMIFCLFFVFSVNYSFAEKLDNDAIGIYIKHLASLNKDFSKDSLFKVRPNVKEDNFFSKDKGDKQARNPFLKEEIQHENCKVNFRYIYLENDDNLSRVKLNFRIKPSIDKSLMERIKTEIVVNAVKIFGDKYSFSCISKVEYSGREKSGNKIPPYRNQLRREQTRPMVLWNNGKKFVEMIFWGDLSEKSYSITIDIILDEVLMQPFARKVIERNKSQVPLPIHREKLDSSILEIFSKSR
jgi:hypothetical protein